MGDNKFKIEKEEKYKNYVSKLEDKYLMAFEKIELYINASTKLQEKEKNDCLLQIIDTFLSGQSEGKVVEDITGKSLKNYCDNMIYGEAMYIHKASRICSTIIWAYIYIFYMESFIRIFKSVIERNWGAILKPVQFNIGDVILIIGYMCIPKLIDKITRNYFEDPVRCKKVKKYTYYIVWLVTLVVYTFIKDMFIKYAVEVSLLNVLLIFIYFFIIDAILDGGKNDFNDRNDKKEIKYSEYLKTKYVKYKLKCEKHNRKAEDWSQFLKKKSKENIIVIVMYLIYIGVFLGFIVLTIKYILFHGTDTVASVILFVCGIAVIFCGAVFLEGIRRNKQLTKE